MTWDGTNVRLFKNGDIVLTVAQTITPAANTKSIRIGDSAGGTTFIGSIDEVSIWNVALTPEQIRENMNRRLTGTENGLVSVWHFDEGSGTTVKDSKDANHGILVNGATWISSTAPLGVTPPVEVKPPTAWSFPLSLKKGLNMISLALKPETPFTAKSFAAALGATLIVRYDTAQSKFTAYIPAAAGAGVEGFPIEGGMGYIVNALEDKELKFTGQPWGEPVSQAPPIAEHQNDVPGSVWAFVVSGALRKAGNLPVPSTPASVQVTNLRSGVTATATPEGSEFQVLFVDLSRSPVVLAGDTLEVVALDANGARVSGPFRLEVQPHHLRLAYLQTQMLIGDVIPEKTRLLANYPNPFNPETWIPYELAEAASVTLDIYDLSGKLVRRLRLGLSPAGTYVDKSRAIYWDGRNDAGERVGSGMYFYRFQAGNFTAVQKMVVLK